VTTTEPERLAALHEYRLLDAPAGEELEAVVRVAAVIDQAVMDLRATIPGRIWADAAEGGGTVVTFTLPGA
jgi:hypothetical protein